MKPISLKKTPSLPTTLHPYEAPEIHAGFLQLISSYAPLDESFVNAWNEGSDPRVSITTYLALQNVLSLPPPFLTRPSTGVTSGTEPMATGASTPERSLNGMESVTSSPSTTTESIAMSLPDAHLASRVEHDMDADKEPEPETTDIQKADLLITQQWLRLIVWQSSFRQQLLSWTAPDESMRFAFPLAIASRTASVLQSLPPQAIEVHGMGIFEKIFEIGTWSMNVLQACDMAGAGTGLNGSGGAMGMDFAGATDLGVLGVGRVGFSIDPLEFFVRTLSASPNSRKQYAERLLLFASENPGGMRMSLSPALSAPSSPEFGSSPNIWSRDENSNQTTGILGSVLGEVPDNTDPGGHMQQALRQVAAGSAALYGGGESRNLVTNTNGVYGGFGDMLPGPAVFDPYDTSRSGSSSPLENRNVRSMGGMTLQNLS
ncbi:c6 zinc finger domain containing protein [Grosmannia clavigera kw1407]|uniref:C6 zinc finger domain containing protein n=1 Tax=Grosmannia clavigera (strain kw1407 / UAMH 11150) TaxID=655863 RepID=F0X7U4_GROCL|nr:c6 zinc finger domain containing protein [Grosmannia clavigera kw1407]EFX06231.1 c6 zinc finger domain containing protein [Grosmannia clavigera kw1407]